MFKYESNEYINAGTNEFYRYGRKAQDMIKAYLEPNEKGFYSIPADGGKYYTIGTSEGKFGEFAKFEDTFLSVNKGGYVWAKVGTPKAEAFVKMLNTLLNNMIDKNNSRFDESNEEDEN